MSVHNLEKPGFWKTLWRTLAGTTPMAAKTVVEASSPALKPVFVPVPAPGMTAPVALDRKAAASSRFGSGDTFMLAARLASAQSLNAPVQRRDGKPPITPRQSKPVQGQKAKPKAAAAVAKKSQPARHVWLSSRPEPKQSADIIRFVPRSQRQGHSRAA